jgi:RNA polymerase sigma-70 factor (ECF subfamily)
MGQVEEARGLRVKGGVTGWNGQAIARGRAEGENQAIGATCAGRGQETYLARPVSKLAGKKLAPTRGRLRLPQDDGLRWAVRKAESVADLASVLGWARDEAELVTELQAGTDAAFDWLVTHYHASVYGVVFGMLGDAADAADITQEVFLKAFRGIRGFRQGSSLKTWLYRIGVREALNYKRWTWRHHRQQTSIDAETPDGVAAINLEDHAASPFEQYATHEVQAAVREGLRVVPEVFRSAVILRDLEGMSYEEVAEVLEVSVGTVKSRILRGRQALRMALGPILSVPKHAAESREATEDSKSAREPGAHTMARGWGGGARITAPGMMSSAHGSLILGSNRGGAK